MAEVKGAGSDEMRENPKVHSKGETFHGKPHTPGRVTHPGGTAPLTGTRVAGHTENGHKLPREVPHPHEKHVVTNHHPKAERSDSGALDRGSYTGPKGKL